MAKGEQQMNLVFRLKGGPGSGHRGHAGRPGSVGGSVPGGIVGALGTADTLAEVNKLRRQAIKVLDAADTKAVRQHPKNYEELRNLRSSYLPEGYPQSEGELEELVKIAKDRIRSRVVVSRSAGERRAERIGYVRDSEGGRRARKFE